MKTHVAIACTLFLLTRFAVAGNDLGIDGDKMVEPDCDALSSWYECRDIDDAPANVRRGFEYTHNTSSTLGPDGNIKFSDGTPYATAATACSSCHFSAGQVPFGTPLWQTATNKYEPDPVTGLGRYFGPMGYYRDIRDSVIDCFRNCMNTDRTLAKDDPVMDDYVAYMEWLTEGIKDPAMREDFTLLPPEAGIGLPRIAGVSSMRANPRRGRRQYQNQCADCHDEDGPGLGEYRVSEDRPRTPALWGMRDGHSRAAAFYRNGVLAAYIQTHMPLDDPNTLSAQQALNIAAYINAPDKPRPDGLADTFFCFDDLRDGIPAALKKPADWLVGCTYPGEREHFEAQGIDYEDMVRNGPWSALTAWRQDRIEEFLGQ
jgi:thiosulfate dehydrogenase